MEILVFKTSVAQKQEVEQIKPILSTIQGIRHWSFDLDDCDKILRIVAGELNPRKVESVMQRAGFSCLELED